MTKEMATGGVSGKIISGKKRPESSCPKEEKEKHQGRQGKLLTGC